MTVPMISPSKLKQCPQCDSIKLQRIGVSGIKKCTECGAFVDVRQKNWLKRLISA